MAYRKVGGDETSYDSPLPKGETHRERMLGELGESIDRSRVHFLGKVPYPLFLNVLQISSAHVYLTYPFVLSWSMLEAMASGCLIIGSRTAPVQEVIRDQENGLLVDFFSPQDIANRVVSVLEEPRAYTQLRENARLTILEEYDLHTRCLPAQLALIRSIVAG